MLGEWLVMWPECLPYCSNWQATMSSPAPLSNGTPSGQSYRPDIDGLRALAVLPVVLYHAKVPGFSGGFIGVDIFFVISGFLITGIIAREVDAGEFSILTFYERRARRILPALLAMIAFVLIAASWLFLPHDFAGVAPSALAAIGFMANVYLFTQTGYFQASSQVTPLLHTWSLGVEEQFYIGLPILFILIVRTMPAWRLKAVIVLALISFVWAVFKQADSDGFAFYMLPTRAWEMFAGSLLAMGMVPAIRRRWIAEVICAAAVAAIVAATVLYDRHTVFPGVAALVPVLAAAALIHAAPGTRTGQILSMKGPVWIGLISYSLYLWHWPLIVFWRYTLDEKLTGLHSAALIAVSIAVAWLSWRFIERPFRSKARFPAKRIWQWSAGGIGVVAGSATLMLAPGILGGSGWPARFDENALRYANAVYDHSPVRAACVADRIADHSPDCTLGAAQGSRGDAEAGADPSVEPAAIIWGDSHGVEIAWVLGERYAARGQVILQRTRGSCPPAIGYDPATDPRCAAFNRGVLAEIAAADRLSTVYLAGYWKQAPYREARLDQLMDATISQLQQMGKRVVIIGPIPTQPVAVPRLLAQQGLDAPTLPISEFEENTAWFTSHFPKWRARGVTIIEPIDRMTRGDRTMIVAGDSPLYYDDNHLSLAGARHVLGDMPAE